MVIRRSSGACGVYGTGVPSRRRTSQRKRCWPNRDWLSIVAMASRVVGADAPVNVRDSCMVQYAKPPSPGGPPSG